MTYGMNVIIHLISVIATTRRRNLEHGLLVNMEICTHSINHGVDTAIPIGSRWTLQLSLPRILSMRIGSNLGRIIFTSRCSGVLILFAAWIQITRLSPMADW